jgi:prepilin-type N-terminal cleavage/methylation domain-containing protein
MNRSSQLERRGFSLVEVILSLAILTGAIAVLGEAARLAIRNARIARDITQAQLLCESKLAEITAGILEPDPVDGVPFERDHAEAGLSGTAGDDEIAWLYSIDVEQVDDEGLMAVRVTVAQDLPEEKAPVRFELVRWILDPDVEIFESSTGEGVGSEASGSGGTAE